MFYGHRPVFLSYNVNAQRAIICKHKWQHHGSNTPSNTCYSHTCKQQNSNVIFINKMLEATHSMWVGGIHQPLMHILCVGRQLYKHIRQEPTQIQHLTSKPTKVIWQTLKRNNGWYSKKLNHTNTMDFMSHKMYGQIKSNLHLPRDRRHVKTTPTYMNSLCARRGFNIWPWAPFAKLV